MSCAEIRAIAERAAADHEWYRDLMVEHGGPPLLSRPLLDQWYYEQEHPEAEGDRTFTTSGTSTGKRRRIVWAALEIEINNALKRRTFAEHMGSFNRCAVDVGLGLASSSARAVFESIGAVCVEIPYDLPLTEHVHRLSQFGAETLYSMPSFVESLVGAWGDARWPIRKLILVGEVCSREWSAEIAGKIGIDSGDILDTYGCVEAGLVATRCGRCQRYHFVDEIIPETVPASAVDDTWPDAALAADESILVVTSRYRRRMPVVRYITYDVIRGMGEKPCNGRLRAGMDAILGRVGDELKHGERISLHDIERAVLSVDPRIRYRIVLDPAGRLALEVPTSDLPTASIPVLAKAIAGAVPCIGAMINSRILRPFEICRVEEWPAEASGSIKKRVVLRR